MKWKMELAGIQPGTITTKDNPAKKSALGLGTVRKWLVCAHRLCSGLGRPADTLAIPPLKRILRYEPSSVRVFLGRDSLRQDQSQDSCGDFKRRFDVLCAFQVWAAKLLIRDAKPERMIWPKTLVLQHQVLGNSPMSIEGQNNRFHRKVSLPWLSPFG